MILVCLKFHFSFGLRTIFGSMMSAFSWLRRVMLAAAAIFSASYWEDARAVVKVDASNLLPVAGFTRILERAGIVSLPSCR